MLTPYHLSPVSWQDSQVMEATGVWFILVPENAVNTVGEWHPSHAMLAVGIWLDGGSLGTMLAKLRPVPWH
jgi:hypothetical protein